MLFQPVEIHRLSAAYSRQLFAPVGRAIGDQDLPGPAGGKVPEHYLVHLARPDIQYALARQRPEHLDGCVYGNRRHRHLARTDVGFAANAFGGAEGGLKKLVHHFPRGLGPDGGGISGLELRDDLALAGHQAVQPAGQGKQVTPRVRVGQSVHGRGVRRRLHAAILTKPAAKLLFAWVTMHRPGCVNLRPVARRYDDELRLRPGRPERLQPADYAGLVERQLLTRGDVGCLVT